MKILVVLAHPDVDSFNHAIAKSALAALAELDHEISFHDLYQEKFDPVLPAGEISLDADLEKSIAIHCGELALADGLIVIHPNWWGMPPAILTGWIDRVFRPEIAYRFRAGEQGEGVPEPMLSLRCAVVFNTSNTKAKREEDVFGDPLERIWRDCVFGLCSYARFHRTTFRVVATSAEEQRRLWLQEVELIVRDAFDETDTGEIPDFPAILKSI